MRRVLSTLAIATAVAFPSTASAGAIDEVPRDEFERWLEEFTAPAPVPAAPVDAVHSVNAIDGETYDPADAPFPQSRPINWGAGSINMDGLLDLFAIESPSTLSTPEWNSLPPTTDTLIFVFIQTEGDTSEGAVPGFNFNFDVDPATFGAKLDGSSTPGDCAIDAFDPFGESSLTTSVVDPQTAQFSEVEAPLWVRTFPDGAFFAFPPSHPCAGATGIGPASYVLAGPTIVEHDVVGPGDPPLPFPPLKLQIVDNAPISDGEGGVAPGSGTATISADPKTDGGDDGVPPLLIIGGSLALGGLAYGGVRIAQGRRGTNEWVHHDRLGLGTADFGDGSDVIPDNLGFGTQYVPGSRTSEEELEEIPTARDPWAILQMTPGVLADRIADTTTPPPSLDPESAARINAYIASLAAKPDPSDPVDLDPESAARISAYIASLVPPQDPAPLSSEQRQELEDFLRSIDDAPPVEGAIGQPGPVAPAPPSSATSPEETPPPLAPESEEKDLLENLERHRRAHRERTGEELPPETEAAYLGYLLDDQDIRDMSDRMKAAYGDETTDEPEVPDSLKLQTDPEPEGGSVLDKIDESGPPPGLS